MNSQSAGRLILIAGVVLVIAACGKKADSPQVVSQDEELPALEQNFVYLTNRNIPPAKEDTGFVESPNEGTEDLDEGDAEIISPILD